MEKTVSIEIPAPPEGYEAFCAVEPSASDLYYSYARKMWVKAERNEQGHQGIVARRRQSLADWANGQRLFQALAQMAKDYHGREMTIETQATMQHGQWTIREGLHWPNMGPAPFHGKLRLEGGKWVDA